MEDNFEDVDVLEEDDDPESHELSQVPRLGAARIRELTESGIETIAALRAVAESDLAQVKLIGAGNARLIKEWLAARDISATESDVAPATEPDPATEVTSPPELVEPTQPIAEAETDEPAADSPAPPAPLAEPVEPDVPITTEPEAPAAEDSEPVSGDLVVPSSPWPESLSKDVDRIDTVIHRLTETLPKKIREKKLTRQLDKVSSSLREVPDDLTSLEEREKAVAVRALARIEVLLVEAVESGKMSAKKQDAMSEELRKHRKRLEKAIGS